MQQVINALGMLVLFVSILNQTLLRKRIERLEDIVKRIMDGAE